MKLSNLAIIKTNFENADFWIIRKGSEDVVGKPVRTFNSEHIGVKVTRIDFVTSEYLFYAIEYLHSVIYFKVISKGTLNLKHITIEDVASIELERA